MHGTDDDHPGMIGEALRSAAEAGRLQTTPVDVAAAVTEGSRRRRARRRRGQVLGSTFLVVLTAAVLVPALALRSPAGSVARAPLVHATIPVIRGGSDEATVVACKGSWLRLSMSLVAPTPKEGATPPVTLHEDVTVRSTHRCKLREGWLALRSVHESGTPSAMVRQSDVGRASSIVLEPASGSGGVTSTGTAARVAVARMTLRVPWYLPYGNLCAAGVTLGITPPGTHRAFDASISSPCGTGSLGTLRARVEPFEAVSLSRAR